MAVLLGDILEVGFEGTIYSQKVLSVFHYRVDVAPTVITDSILSQASVLNEIKATGAQDKVTKYLACISNNYTLDRITAQYIYPARYRRSFLYSGAAATRVGAANTANTSAVITKLTRRAGKSFRGSLHLPGIVNSDYSSGTILAPLNNLMVILASDLINPLTEPGGGAGIWNPIIFHRNAPGSFAEIWNDYAIQQTLRIMRRRTVGVGK